MLYKLLVSFMEEGMVVDWKAEIFAGVYAGYELSEMKTATINVVLYSFPTPLPKDQYVYTEKEFVLCYWFPPKELIWNSWSWTIQCYQPS